MGDKKLKNSCRPLFINIWKLENTSKNSLFINIWQSVRWNGTGKISWFVK